MKKEKWNAAAATEAKTVTSCLYLSSEKAATQKATTIWGVAKSNGTKKKEQIVAVKFNLVCVNESLLRRKKKNDP